MSEQESFSVSKHLHALAALVLVSSAISASAQVSVANNTPKFIASAIKLGAVEPSTPMDVSIWLKPHNKAGLDALAKELYDRNSPNFHHWLTKEKFAAEYAPTEAELNQVRNFATANHLTVSKLGPNNFYVRVTGTAGAMSNAFHVSLDNYDVKGKVVRAKSEDPRIEGQAASLIGSIEGLDSMSYSHPLVVRRNGPPGTSSKPGVNAVALTSETAARPEVSSVLPASSFNPKCFVGTTNQTFTSSGSQPDATYKGNEYTANPAGCGYTPQNIRAAYGLNALYADKFDGTGQTIVIIDWCGSPTITSDANAFSKQFGLPALTSKNFKIIYTPTPSYCEAPDAEINLDVEWAHAIAPGAAIDLVVPPSSSFQDIDEAFFYSVNYGLGNVISGSYGAEELGVAASVLETESLIAEIAAVNGISANFSTGDSGDFTFDDPTANPASVSSPADLPYATGVGGISLALNSDNSIAWQTGWGTNLNSVADEGYVTDPPSGNGFFNFGSGGGESAFFAKPAFQSGLPGNGRQLPDVSWLADPYTGAYIAISEPLVTPELQYEAIGGTSLACPMFSALWAIANQIAGFPLGQAAPYLYGLPASVMTDIVPLSSKTNITGKVTDSDGITNYSAASLVEPLEKTTSFISALWDYPLYEDTAYILTFGTDSGLTIKKGWDNVTGVGVPNPGGFKEYFKP